MHLLEPRTASNEGGRGTTIRHEALNCCRTHSAHPSSFFLVRFTLERGSRSRPARIVPWELWQAQQRRATQRHTTTPVDGAAAIAVGCNNLFILLGERDVIVSSLLREGHKGKRDKKAGKKVGVSVVAHAPTFSES